MSGRISEATAHALRLVASGTNPHRAAKIAGIAVPTIYRAIKRARQRAQSVAHAVPVAK